MWKARDSARGIIAILLLSTVTTMNHAAGANYPDKPIRIVVPFAAGSGTDLIARIMAEELSKALETPMIVDNKPGASGQIGTDFVVKSPPDGYTLLITSSATHSANPGLIKKLSYHPIRHFAHISLLITDPLIFSVHPSVAQTLQEFIAVAKNKKLSFGYGSASSLVAASTFNSMAKLDALAVPYKSQPPAAADVAGGHIHYIFADATATGSLIRGGKLRALAMTGAQRAELFPDVPTLAEQGFKDYDLQVWVGLAAPAGTPADIVRKLNAEVRKTLTRPDVRQTFRSHGKTVAPNSIEEQNALVQRQLEVWARRIAEAGLQAE